MKKTVTLLCSIIFVSLLSVVFFSSCTKQGDTAIVYRDSSIIQYRDTSVNITQDTTPNKQTYVLFLNTSVTTDSTTPVAGGVLPLFNISSYVGADSVLLVYSGYNTSSSGSFVVDLYDVTDSMAIIGSVIVGSDQAPTPASPLTFHVSPNILSALPAKPITLMLRVTSSATTNYVVGGSAFLMVYKY